MVRSLKSEIKMKELLALATNDLVCIIQIPLALSFKTMPGT